MTLDAAAQSLETDIPSPIEDKLFSAFTQKLKQSFMLTWQCKNSTAEYAFNS